MKEENKDQLEQYIVQIIAVEFKDISKGMMSMDQTRAYLIIILAHNFSALWLWKIVIEF